MTGDCGQSSSRCGVLVLGGPSGAGKSTLVRAVLDPPRIRLAISATTRAPRRGERDGVDYHFVSRERFEELVREGALLEWAQVHDHHYGTPRSELEPRSEEERCVILDVDVQGLRSVKELGVEHLSVFVAPPSLQSLRARLAERGSEDAETLALRLRNAEREMARSNEYDRVLVNEDLDAAIEEFRRALPLRAPGARDGRSET